MSCTVAFVGCPNVGKSTVFNALTGLRQHTGNWTGKTVDPARGRWTLDGLRFEAVDLPGIYSLAGGTPEERVAADWLAAARPELLVAVLDATALERSLALTLELLALPAPRPRLLVCLNLTDEAERLGLKLDLPALAAALGCPVVPTRADRPSSYETLRKAIGLLAASPKRSCEKPLNPRSVTASEMTRAVTLTQPRPRRDWDRLLLGRRTALPLSLLLLFLLLYLTVRGANLPSALLGAALDRLGAALAGLLAGLPPALRSLLLEGIWATLARVVAVMLPPMAIFFPLFSLLEDLGLLPRLAFLADRPFAACGSCGRQGLCMCMGLGCNAVGVSGCRIIPERKARLAAILTNAMTPCNGRFPTLIVLAGVLLGREAPPPAAAAVLSACLLLSAGLSLLTTALLRRTLLRGEAGTFVLELPPFRRPRLGRVLLRSLLDRTLRVLGRAVCAAAPAGALLWVLGRLAPGGRPLLAVLAGALDPAAALLGLTGTLLLAFLLSFPANELLLPLALLIGGAGGAALTDPALLFTARSALCAALFTLFHWPCAATLLTVYHETKSLRWTALAALVPTAVGAALCMGVNALFAVLT